MDGIIPLINQVPDREPTINKIKIAPVIDFKFKETSLIIDLNEMLFFIPISTPIDAPIKRIN